MTSIQVGDPHNEAMLAFATRFLRIVACLLIAGVTFVGTPDTGVTLALEIVAYTLGVLSAIGWVIFDGPQSSAGPPALIWGWAITAAVSGVMLGAPNAGALIGFSFMAVLATSMDRAPISRWLVFVTSVLAIEVSTLFWDLAQSEALGYVLLLGGGFVMGSNRRVAAEQAEQAAAMLGQAEQLRAEQRQVTLLEERTRIAREIHDVLAHSLGALGIQVQVVRAALTDHRDVDRALVLLEQAQRMTADGLVDSRRAIQALRGDATRLDQQIEALAETHRSRHATDTTLTIDGDQMQLPPETTVALVRIAQEALVNTAKHAPHQPVDVRLCYQENQVELTISNPIPSADPEPSFGSVNGGYGLTGMRERLLLINGTLATGSADHRWTVTARVPR